MDQRLVAWAREVKARRRRRDSPGRMLRARRLPVLWLFTDERRLPDPRPVIAALPRGLCGVVFRHDGAVGRAGLARAVARQCRTLAIPLVVAGDARLAAALGAGVHLRGGRQAGSQGLKAWRNSRALVTSSAHSGTDMRRARTMGADAVFLSPVLPSQSHPGAPALGIIRWAALTRSAPGSMALGGVTGRVARRLPRWCDGAGAIGAWGGRDVGFRKR